MHATLIARPLVDAAPFDGSGLTLGNRQSAFASALLDPDAPVPAGLVGPNGQPSALRFAVYRNNVALGLVEALKAAFPVVCALVGDAFFAAMARAHVLTEPPASPVMLEYGAGFPDLIARFEPAAVLPYLGDVARLEWAWVEAYHAAEALPLSPATIAQVREEDMPYARLLLHPSIQIICSGFPVVAIWTMHADGCETEGVSLDRGGQDALVSRPGADVEIRCLPAGAAAFIETLLAGASIVEAMQAGLAISAQFDLADALARLIEAGAIIGFETGTHGRARSSEELP